MCFNPVETGERIRRLREHLGYSQTQLSEKINFSRSYICLLFPLQDSD